MAACKAQTVCNQQFNSDQLTSWREISPSAMPEVTPAAALTTTSSSKRRVLVFSAMPCRAPKPHFSLLVSSAQLFP